MLAQHRLMSSEWGARTRLGMEARQSEMERKAASASEGTLRLPGGLMVRTLHAQC